MTPTVRQARREEAYFLACPDGHEFETPAAEVDRLGYAVCRCGRRLPVEWIQARSGAGN